MNNSEIDPARMRREFNQGHAAALDPTNREAMASSGIAKTTLSSPWLHKRCEVCGHTFRPGDVVKIDERRRARHFTPTLPCAGAVSHAGDESGGGSDSNNGTDSSDTDPKKATSSDENSELPTDRETREFFQGIDQAWPPPPHAVRLTGDHRLLAPPVHGFQRHACVVCGHTLRPHDQVVICPCSPHNHKCGVAVHQDPAHGLHCYSAWNPGAKHRHCPVTSRVLEDE